MNPNASPGPDGFGPAFYRKFWPKVKDTITPFFNDFFQTRAETGRLNQAHVVLLPKGGATPSPDSFHPISLQNCPMKLATKVMANRLRTVITELVNMNQTRFIHRRCIAENFIFAADILNCCYKRRALIAVLKLDFKKRSTP